MKVWIILCLVAVYCNCNQEGETSVTEADRYYKVEGTIILPADALSRSTWQSDVRIQVNYGETLGFVKKDGTFTIHNLLPGSHLIQVFHVDYDFEAVRVDITSKGKMRYRRNNSLKPSDVQLVPAPLRMMPRAPIVYFKPKEGWRITDALMNPMVLMLLVPMALMYIMPKMVSNDPELKKEMESMQMPKMDVPDVSEMLSSWLGGAPPKKEKKAIQGRKK
uniref:DUF2012 domain-containing protein n=1 Tax=Rhabditophanes sp. KR3021 TaxID=114890 RepID=A0AC35TRE1_9BILA